MRCGVDGLELDIQDGRIGPSVVQHQVKVYPSTKLVLALLKSVMDKAGGGLAKVMHAADVTVTHVELHIWYYGEPVDASDPGLADRYRAAFANRLASLQGKQVQDVSLPRVTILFHQYEDVLKVLPSGLKMAIEELPLPWKTKKTRVTQRVRSV